MHENSHQEIQRDELLVEDFDNFVEQKHGNGQEDGNGEYHGNEGSEQRDDWMKKQKKLLSRRNGLIFLKLSYVH
jgi:hypothetical protein